MRLRVLAAAIALACLPVTAANAASLRVSPVLLDVPSGQTGTTLTVSNDDKAPIRVQVRVYLWTHKGNSDTLTPTKAVVASPPIGVLKPGAENLVRIVRVATTPVAARESYRVLVDQLPDPKRTAGVVSILVRHAIPLYFEP